VSATAAETQPTDDDRADGRRAGKRYGFSVLLSGIAVARHQWWGLLLVVLVNAVVQMLTGVWTPLTTDTPQFYLSSLISFVVLVASLGAVCALALACVDRRRGVGAALRSGSWGRFALWTVGLTVVVYLLTFAWVAPAVIAMFLVPFVPLAAMDGKRNPLAVNFRVIGARWARYIVTVVFWAIIMVVVFVGLVLAFITFPWWGVTLLGWVLKGLVGVWLICAFAGLYRSTRAGMAED
jgi:hypothetical protein